MHTPHHTHTIVAVATPPGVGAIGVIRLSGTQSIHIAQQLFTKDITTQATHTVHHGWLQQGTTLIDEVVLTLYRNPKSYTGEDVVEIGCHGSPYIQQTILAALIQLGARLAMPGEYTQRAFLNGKLDLTQAEAVADVIASNTAAAQQAALHTMRGGFKHILQALREELIQFAALIELELDFAEEDVTFADRTKLTTLLNTIEATTLKLIQSFALGNVIKQGVTVAIVGKPNAGKSTLLNALLNDERAIVSEIPGTTRDTIEETLNIQGIIFRIIDTAGIRSNGADAVEAIGIQRSLHNATTAHIVLHLVDVTAADTTAIPELASVHDKTITVYNKCDTNWAQYQHIIPDTNTIYLSAKHQQGIPQLTQLLYTKAVGSTIPTEHTIITNARHHSILLRVHQCIQDIKQGMLLHTHTDLIAQDIRHCLNYIGELTGDISNENVLDYIFSKFCIGK